MVGRHDCVTLASRVCAWFRWRRWRTVCLQVWLSGGSAVKENRPVSSRYVSRTHWRFVANLHHLSTISPSSPVVQRHIYKFTVPISVVDRLFKFISPRRFLSRLRGFITSREVCFPLSYALIARPRRCATLALVLNLSWQLSVVSDIAWARRNRIAELLSFLWFYR